MIEATGATVDADGEAFVRVVVFGGPLSARERQVLCGAADGYTNAEIGRRLFMSEHTVKAHLLRVCRRLRARDRTHAVHLAWQRGLLP